MGFSEAPGLLVTVSGPGAVSSTPGGVDCEGTCAVATDCARDCEQAFVSDTLVDLVATPTAGSRFVGWGGDCATAASATIAQLTMDVAKRCSASFSSGAAPTGTCNRTEDCVAYCAGQCAAPRPYCESHESHRCYCGCTESTER
jgi:hypothetical protein